MMLVFVLHSIRLLGKAQENEKRNFATKTSTESEPCKHNSACLLSIFKGLLSLAHH